MSDISVIINVTEVEASIENDTVNANIIVNEQEAVIIGIAGPRGATGPQGPTGAQGPQGNPGEGVAPGGTTGQILVKSSNADFDTEWDDPEDVSAVWGSITGDLSDQTDLQNALNAKLNASDFNLSTFDTDDLDEGATNLYYTDARASSVAAGLISAFALTLGTAAYASTGDFATAAQGALADTALQNLSSLTTSDLAEGSNLYFTDGRAVTALTGQDVSLFNNDAGYITSSALTGYVPYINATAPVDLGENSLSLSARLNIDKNGINFTYVTKPTAPTVALAGVAGLVPVGTHWYYVTYVTADGETDMTRTAASITVASAANAQVIVTIPISSDPRVIARKIYRSVASVVGGFLATVADNTTTTYTDNIATVGANLIWRTPTFGNTTAGNIFSAGSKTIEIDNVGAMRFANGASSLRMAAATNTQGRVAIFNTADEENNAEYGGFNWLSNVFEVGTFARGAGAARKVRLKSSNVSVSMNFELERGGTDWASIIDSGTSAGGVSFTRFNPTNWTNNGGENRVLTLGTVGLNQTSSGGYSLFNIDATGGTGGSGSKFFSRYTLGGTTIHSVNNLGQQYLLGNIGINTTPNTTYNLDAVGAVRSGFRFTSGTRSLAFANFAADVNYLSTTGAAFRIITGDANGIEFWLNNTRAASLSAVGSAHFGTPNAISTTYQMSIQPTVATNRGLVVTAFSGQTANLGEFNFDATTYAQFNNRGGLYIRDEDTTAPFANAGRPLLTLDGPYGSTVFYGSTFDVANINLISAQTLYVGRGGGGLAVGPFSGGIVNKFHTAGNASIGVNYWNTTAPTNGLLVEGNSGFGTGATVSARIHAISTTSQLRIGYDPSNYFAATVGSTGITTFSTAGSAATTGFILPITAIGGNPSASSAFSVTRPFSTPMTANNNAINVTTTYSPSSNETTYTNRGAFFNSIKGGAFNSLDVRGFQAQADNQGTGAITSLYGFIAGVANSSTGVVTNGYGAFVVSPAASALNVMTNAYGLYVSTQARTGVTNAYGIYQQGASDLNYFAGSVQMGATGQPVKAVYSATATLDFPSIGANDTAALTMTVTGAAVGDSVELGAPSTIEAGLVWCGFVSATNTVTVRVHNTSGGAVDPASATWRATVTDF